MADHIEKALRDWDPLEQIEDPGIVLAAQKREITNILKSYTGYYDLFAELVQNALDALERRLAEADASYNASLEIAIDLEANTVNVTDNGCGMSLPQFKSFLKPSLSFKDISATRGNKGVGATFLAYGFNELTIATRQDAVLCAASLRHGRDWIEDQKNIVSRPRFEPQPAPPGFAAVDRGTSVTLKLVGDNIRPKALSYFQATTATQWMAILRVHTALGGIYLGGAMAPQIAVRVRVKNRDQGWTEVSLLAPRYLYPHEVLGRTADYREFLKEQQEKTQKQRDATSIPPKYTKLNGLWGEWTAKEIVEGNSPIKPRWSDEDARACLDLGITLYAYMGYTTELYNDYNDNHLGLRKGSRILKGGLQLATRHMPQGSPLTIELKEDIGFQHLAHIIVHFENAEPDLGRKGFQPEETQLAHRLAASAVRALKRHYGTMLRKKTGAPALIQGMQLQNWIDQQRDHERLHPLRVKGISGFFLPTQELPISSVPIVEQDVVALFNQMLSSGLIRGIQLLASSQYKQYDGLYRVVMEQPFGNYTFGPKNPLGVNPDQFVGVDEPLQSPVRVLEYKHSLDDLIEEFTLGHKSPDEIGLVVVWKLGNKWKEGFDIISYLDPDHIHHRQIHGLTHGFSHAISGTPAFQAIALSDLIAYCTNQEQESRKQKQLYRED